MMSILSHFLKLFVDRELQELYGNIIGFSLDTRKKVP